MIKLYLIDLIFLMIHGINLLVTQLMKESVGQTLTILYYMVTIIISYYVIFNMLHILIDQIENTDNYRRVFLCIHALYNFIPSAYFFINIFYFIPRILNERNESLYISYYIFYLLYSSMHMVIAIRKAYFYYRYSWATTSRVKVYIQPTPPNCIIIEKPVIQGGDQKCCICMDKKTDATLIPCGHKEFCFDCVQRVFPHCPICRTNFQTIEYECITLV